MDEERVAKVNFETLYLVKSIVPIEKIVEMSSLANRPNTAMLAKDLGELVILLWKKLNIKNTTLILPTCSIS